MEIQQKSKIKGNDQSSEDMSSTTITNTNNSPSSSSSSPSHEFSFTISFQYSSSTPNPDETKSLLQPPSGAVDLTPADDIFLHGTLLPLHAISPRSSANSLDSFTYLPIKELLGNEGKSRHIDSCVCNSCDKSTRHSFNSIEYNNTTRNHDELPTTKKRVKSKSFTFFGLARRQKDDGDSSEKAEKRKVKYFDVGHLLKKYIRMFSNGRREDSIQLRKQKQQQQQPYSFSGKSSSREGRMNLRGRRREFSAPVSMRTSPTNSGVLKTTGPAGGANANPHSSNDSSMEELQSAIQAAIAHCKNSINCNHIEA